MLKKGDKAPDFTLPSDDETLTSLSELRGKKVVLYFYPKDDTPGCSREACSFRDSYEDILARDAIVIGVSADSVESHREFRLKYDLPFRLLSDTRTDMIRKYHAWGERKAGDQMSEGVLRITYVIDEEGIIIRCFDRINPASHGEEIAEFLSGL